MIYDVLSVHAGEQEDRTVNIRANLDDPFSSYEYLKFQQIGNSTKICDVIELNSLLKIYTEFLFLVFFSDKEYFH